jgi:hypothetical protein
MQSRVCQFCGQGDNLKRCSRCQRAYYCTVECQKKDYAVHKNVCFKIDLSKKIQTQEELIASGAMQFHFVNPRKDRSVQKHGNDTHPVHQKSRALKDFIKQIGSREEYLVFAKADMQNVMPYGRCFKNAQVCAEKYGGVRICGWMLWEGKYMIEAEAHAVWAKDDNPQHTFNVTSTMEGLPYEGWFLMDMNVLFRLEQHQGVPNNMVYWK